MDKLNVRENVLISEMTTMRLGGRARYVVEVSNEEDVESAYEFAASKELPVFVVGSGSNLIGRDEGFDGILILNRIFGMEISSVPDSEGFVLARCGGGVVLDDFCGFLAENGYSGMEAMSGIPGTVGAVAVQNAGAYGQEIRDSLVYVRAYDVETGEFVEIKNEDCGFAYRRSIFNTTMSGRYFITSITVRAKKGSLVPPFYRSLQAYLEQNEITDYSPMSIRQAVLAVRDMKLPDPLIEASAGSFFKNIHLSDEEAVSARARGIEVWEMSDGARNVVPSGWLIEHAGLKGREFHGFMVSDKAALILINKSSRSYEDLEKARAAIRKAVFEKFGFELEQEPVEIE